MDTNQLAYLFLRKAAQLNGQINKALSEALDLTSPQLRIMEIVGKSEPTGCSVNTIKAKMLDPMSNVSRMLNKLEKKALVTRSPSPDDQRSVVIRLTENGWDSLNEGKAILDQQLTKLDYITPSEAEFLADILNRIPE